MRKNHALLNAALGAALAALPVGAQAAAGPAAPAAVQASFQERSGALGAQEIRDAGQGRRANFVFTARNGGQGAGRGFVDEDGDGINDLAPDHDGDGVPNCQDADWVKSPRDGTGNKNGNPGSGGGGRGNGSRGGRAAQGGR